MVDVKIVQSGQKNVLSIRDRILLFTGYTLLGLAALLIIVPLIYVIIASFLTPASRASGLLDLSFDNWTLEGYKVVFQEPLIWSGFKNSFIYSLLFTIISVGTTVLAAYPLSRDDFRGKKFFTAYFMLTMFIGGGLMPTFLTIERLGLMDTIWAVILPNAVNVWNLILARTYLKSVPKELNEAAKMDGATDFQFFFKILLPLLKPIIFVLCLYQFVAQWNSYFDAMIYISDQESQPLQLILRSILVENKIQPGMMVDSETAARTAKLASLLKYSTIVVSSIPLLIMYPFFSKYFEKGLLVGSVKG